MAETICGGWEINTFCCFLSYKDSKCFPLHCEVHDCEAWDCFTDLPPPGGKPCPDCLARENGEPWPPIEGAQNV